MSAQDSTPTPAPAAADAAAGDAGANPSPSKLAYLEAKRKAEECMFANYFAAFACYCSFCTSVILCA
jgi:hypothetical protein